MKQRLVSVVAASMVAGTTLFGANGFFGMSYVNVVQSDTTSQGFSVNTGVKFGETFKQRFGTELIALTDSSDDSGGMINFYYSLGYEVLPSFIVAANVGYGFEDIGTIGSGSNSTTVYATGMSYGATLVYEFTQHIDGIAEYKKYNLDYEGVSFDRDVATLGLAYNF